MSFRQFQNVGSGSIRFATLFMMIWPLLAASESRAEERKFLILKANLPRSFPEEEVEPRESCENPNLGAQPGEPRCAMPSIPDIERVYYLIDPDNEEGSFAEYWVEVSYNIVNIVGKGMGTADLPWPQFPVRENDTTTEDMLGTIEEEFSPSTASTFPDGDGYFDLNGIGDFQYGVGERLREDRALYNTDYDGTAGPGDLPDPQPGTFDNIFASFGEDIDGDGHLDFGIEDFDDDENFDLTNEDMNKNCALDFAISEDCICGDCDGVWDPVTEDCDGNGEQDFINEDLDLDGRLDSGEIICYNDDKNCNGKRGSLGDLPIENIFDGNNPTIFEVCEYFDQECQVRIYPDPDVELVILGEKADGTLIAAGEVIDCLSGDKFDLALPAGAVIDNGDGTKTYGPFSDVDRTEDLDDDGNFDILNEDSDENGMITEYVYDPADHPFYDLNPVWTPGERFRDLDSDTYYDAMFEPAVRFNTERGNDDEVNNYSDTNATLTDPQDYIDINDNNRRDFPEPLEDRLVMKTSNEEGEPQYFPVELKYIVENYPGNIPLLLERTGNKRYDPPDGWVEVEDVNRKLEVDTLEPTVQGHTTPEPSWYEDFWSARFGMTSAAELPEWTPGTPNLVEFSPLEASTFEDPEINFTATAGGTSGWGTVLEQMLHLGRADFMFDINCLGLDSLQDLVKNGAGFECPCDPPTAPECANDPNCQPDGIPDGCPSGMNIWGVMFDYDGTEHFYGYDDGEINEDSRLTKKVANDFIFQIAEDGMSGWIDQNILPPPLNGCHYDADGIEDSGVGDFDGDGTDDDYFFDSENVSDPVTCNCIDIDYDPIDIIPIGNPDGIPDNLECEFVITGFTQACDFDGDGESDAGSAPCNVPDTPVLPPAPPDFLPRTQPGSMVDMDGDGLVNDWLFSSTILDPVDLPFFDFTETLPACNCIDFNVDDSSPQDGLPDINWPCASCEFIPEEDQEGEDDNCFKPECESIYLPIPIFIEPAAPDYEVRFSIKYGNGIMLDPAPSGYPEGSETDSILPPADLVYDGPKEYDDLASSFYHTRWVSGSGYADAPEAVLLDYGGDQALGEVTTSSPDVADRNNYGHDKAGFGTSGLTHDPDGFIVPAGPLAGGANSPNGDPWPVHGGPGVDGGNLLTLELLTRRTDGKALTEPLTRQSGPPITDSRGFRDFNLDGMIDLGEGRAFGTENYSIDSYDFTPNSGMYPLMYPFCRDRLVEDVIEALDPAEDFDDWVGNSPICGGGIGADISHMIVLPAGLPSNRPFAVFSPSANLPIITLDAMPLQAGGKARLQDMLNAYYTYTNLAASLDRQGETNEQLEAGLGYLLGFAIHEFGHYWECWPDLYDYDTFDGFQLGNPVGLWDLMAIAGSKVHVNPVFKERSGWIKSKDLRTFLTPGVTQEVPLGAIEFAADRYFYFENPIRTATQTGGVRLERFYFFHLEDQGEFNSNLPWGEPPEVPCDEGGGSFKDGGMMILHTDLAANSEAIPPQQRFEGHFSYLYTQADGQHSLEEAEPLGNQGDAGDPYPGFCNVTEFSYSTDPSNRWWNTEGSGIEVEDIVNEEGGSTVTFLWFPQDIPTFRFIQPPGGVSIDGTYSLIYRWDDLFAGSGLSLFQQGNNLTDALEVDELGVCTEDCFGGTKLNGAPLQKASPGNRFGEYSVLLGAGGLADGVYRFYAFLDPAYYSPGFDGGFENFYTDPVAAFENQGQGSLEVTVLKANPDDRDSIRLEGWVVYYLGSNQWAVTGTMSGLQTLPDGSPHYLTTGQQNYQTTNPDGAVRLQLSGSNFRADPPDYFTFATTGFTAYSPPILVEDGEVVPTPIAVIQVDRSSGVAPLTVNFDGSASVDSNGDANGISKYEWDFENDGVIDVSGTTPTASHTYTEAGDFMAELTVTEGPPNYRKGTTSKPIHVSNSSPVPEFTADPTSGPAPLTVAFDASASRDPDGNVPLTFEWDFDYDGSMFDADFGPTSDSNITRVFQEGTWIVALHVTDATGARSVSPATVEINSGNLPPVANFTATPEEVSAGTTVVFDASGSYDPDGDTLDYSWSFGDGTPDEIGKIVTHVYTETGNYPVTLTVEDALRAKRSVTKTIVVTPGSVGDITASMMATPQSGVSPLTVEFSASATSAGGSPLTYRWEFGDGGSFAFGPNVTHIFINDSDKTISFAVKLIVTDDKGTQETDTKQITVFPEGCEECAGDANLVSEFNVSDDSMLQGSVLHYVEFTTAGSRALDGSAVTCRINFGDNTIKTTLPGVAVPHVYDQPDQYEAFSTTIGSTGERVSQTITIIVTVSNTPTAKLTASPINGVTPLTVDFDARESSDPNGDSLVYNWNFGDQTPLDVTSNPSTSHTYEQQGQYVVTLTVSDGTEFDTASVTISVDSPAGTGGNGDLLPPDTGPTQPPPSDGEDIEQTCGGGCAPMGAGQLLMIFIGIFGMKYSRRRYR